MQSFMRRQDNLGKSPQMTYKKNLEFGTSIGGCCSTLARLFICTYVVCTLIAFFSRPNYDPEREEKYQSISDPQVYIMEPTDLIPAIALWEGTTMTLTDLYKVEYQLVEWPEGQVTETATIVESRPAITCDLYIDKYVKNKVFNEDQLKTLEAELYKNPKLFLCPDYQSFNLTGSFLMGQSLQVQISLNDELQAGL